MAPSDASKSSATTKDSVQQTKSLTGSSGRAESVRAPQVGELAWDVDTSPQSPQRSGSECPALLLRQLPLGAMVTLQDLRHGICRDHRVRVDHVDGVHGVHRPPKAALGEVSNRAPSIALPQETCPEPLIESRDPFLHENRGIEVKSSRSSSWTSCGTSVTSGLRSPAIRGRRYAVDTIESSIPKAAHLSLDEAKILDQSGSDRPGASEAVHQIDLWKSLQDAAPQRALPGPAGVQLLNDPAGHYRIAHALPRMVPAATASFTERLLLDFRIVRGGWRRDEEARAARRKRPVLAASAIYPQKRRVAPTREAVSNSRRVGRSAFEPGQKGLSSGAEPLVHGRHLHQGRAQVMFRQSTHHAHALLCLINATEVLLVGGTAAVKISCCCRWRSRLSSLPTRARIACLDVCPHGRLRPAYAVVFQVPKGKPCQGWRLRQLGEKKLPLRQQRCMCIFYVKDFQKTEAQLRAVEMLLTIGNHAVPKALEIGNADALAKFQKPFGVGGKEPLARHLLCDNA
eukprot:scaffold2329_cov247-Pinguiococcus_pyrenoidosus.AAC.7